MNNYEFCAWQTREALVQAPLGVSSPQVLDLGCGAGGIVRLLRQDGIAAFGCDTFGEGGQYRDLPPHWLEQQIIRSMPGPEIPFPDQSFDVVTTNQVLEHVPDLDQSLREIARVLKPRGTLLALFPDRGVWREGHSGVPFFHWFRRGSPARDWFGAVFRCLGFGYHPNGKTPLAWSRDFGAFLDRTVFYHRSSEVEASFDRHFRHTIPIEPLWMRRRCEGHVPFLPFFPDRLLQCLVRKLAGRVTLSTGPRG